MFAMLCNPLQRHFFAPNACFFNGTILGWLGRKREVDTIKANSEKEDKKR
jgi:hypothetical protein